MNGSILMAAAVAGFAYAITPGPGVLALLGIGADRGRRAGAAFLGGHMVGDALWATIALVGIVGVRAVGPMLFDLLGLVSGLYLFWLGLRAVRTRRMAGGAVVRAPIHRPLRHGVVFGLTNPKAYPVAVATFTALLSAKAGLLTWDMLPVLVLASLVGGFAAYMILVGMVGAASVRQTYRRHEVLITRLSGVIFIGFAVNALVHAVPGLVGRRR